VYGEILKKVDRKGIWDMIVIDGVVGSGKSTLMNILEELGYTAFKEPVVNNPILEKFYYDRKKYAFALQVFFLNNRFKYIKEAAELENSVMDRSIYGDAIFAKLLEITGDMTSEISVDQAINRIRKRGRDYEQVVERAYWETLNKEYTEYFNAYDISPVLKINVDSLDFENNLEDRKYVLSLIDEKLKELQ